MVSCQNNVQEKSDLLKDVDTIIELNRQLRGLREIEVERLNKTFYYYRKTMESGEMKDKYEIKYLRTENDKYRILGNLYVDSVNYYNNLLQKSQKK